jgi:glycosyltransferase involved in cell wall biosynthesis
VSRILVVSEALRSIGEFRRAWVRALYGAHVRRYRRALDTALARLAPVHEVTLLAARELVDHATLPAGVSLRLYDEESFKAEAEPLADLGARLVTAWWPRRGTEPGLSVDGVWLPDLLPVAKGILLRLEVLEFLAALERVMDDVKPQRVVLVTGASIAERLARAFAEDRAIPVDTAAWMPSSFVLATLWRTLRVREERQALRQLLRHSRRPAPIPEGRPRIVFTACQARHFEVVEPLTVSLRHDGVNATVLAASVDGAMDARVARVAAGGVPCASFMDYLPRAEARRIVREMWPLRRRLLRRLDADPAYEALARHGSVGLGRLLRPFAANAVGRAVVTARLYLEAARHALDALSPDAVVIASDRRYAERALALAARARGVPVVLFWGASLLSRDRTNTFDVADRLLLIGDDVRAAMVSQGLAPSRLAVVGDPRSNAACLAPRDRLRAQVFADLGLAPGRPLLVLVSKYVSVLFSSEEKAAFYRTVARAVERLGRPNVVVKVHPNEHLALLREQVRGWEWRDAVLTQSYDIHRLFRAADAAVMVTSMAGVEAMAMECPVVAVQTRGKDFEGGYMPPYVSAGAVERVDTDDVEALAAALSRLVGDAAAREALVARGRTFAAQYLHPVDGRLTERLLDVVAEIRAEHAPGERA